MESLQEKESRPHDHRIHPSMKLRFFITPFAVAALLGLIFVLPERGEVAGTSLSRETIDWETKTPPLTLNNWFGNREVATKQELDILSKDTTFIKGTYTDYELPPLIDGDGNRFSSAVNLSIVISGHDMNNSIHRPERCLRAQGHIGLLSLPNELTTSSGKKIKVQRIETKFPLRTKSAEEIPHTIGFVSYYFFVGHQQLTNSHWNRTMLDMKDRILSGTDQQWSFIMASLPYNLKSTAEETQKEQQLADKKIRQFLAELTDEIVRWDQVK